MDCSLKFYLFHIFLISGVHVLFLRIRDMFSYKVFNCKIIIHYSVKERSILFGYKGYTSIRIKFYFL